MMNCLPLYRRSPVTRWLKNRRRKIFASESDGLAAEETHVVIAGAPTSVTSELLIKTVEVGMEDDEEEKNGDSEALDIELQNRLDAIMALRDVVMEQRKKLHSMKTREKDFKEQIRSLKRLQMEMVFDGVSDNNRKRVVRFGPTNERSDAHITTAESSEVGGDSSQRLRDSVQSIVNRAAEIDNAIVLQELDATKSELSAARRKVQSKNDEIERLKAQLAEKDDRVTTLELEKQLLQADNEKIAADFGAFANMATIDKSLPTLPVSSETSQSPDMVRSMDPTSPKNIAAKRRRHLFRGVSKRMTPYQQEDRSVSLNQHLGVRPDAHALLCFRCRASDNRHQQYERQHHQQQPDYLTPEDEHRGSGQMNLLGIDRTLD